MARRCGTKHICKLKYTKYRMFRLLFEGTKSIAAVAGSKLCFGILLEHNQLISLLINYLIANYLIN